MTAPDRKEILDLIAKWNVEDPLRSHRGRDTLRSLAHRYGFKPMAELQDFIEFALTQAYATRGTADPVVELVADPLSERGSPRGGLPFDPHVLAKTMIREGFKAEGMDNVEKALDYIFMASENPNTIDELPPSGIAFWKAADFRFRAWKARSQREAAVSGAGGYK